MVGFKVRLDLVSVVRVRVRKGPIRVLFMVRVVDKLKVRIRIRVRFRVN